MPRRRPQAALPTTSLVAASTRYSGRTDKVMRVYQPEKGWQKECYKHYMICGEARFAAKFFGHAVSRAVLHAADETGELLEAGPAVEALKSMFRGPDGQKQILDALGLHLTIAGDCYLVGRDVEGLEVWEVVSVLEMKTQGDRWYIDYGDGTPIELAADDVIIRIWIPNPAKHIEADSPFRSLLPILREIEWLTRHVFAQISSRLAGAGILFLPQGTTFPPAPGHEGQAEPANEADAFMQALGDAMMESIDDPSSPASLIPGIAMVPGEEINNIKLMHFWSDLDAQSKELRNEAIRRFALGMDLPPEQVLGMGSNGGSGGGTSNGVSHWGAWQIEEATIKMHVEPMLDLIANTLTISYLRALLEGTTDLIGYTTAALRLRPDRSKEAFELWDRGVLATATLLKENGFAVTDLPEPEEFKRWLLIKIASGSATPEQVQAALGALGVPLDTPPIEGPTREARPAPSIEQHPVNPRTPAESALLAASDALVYRALERAGNRLRGAGVKPPGTPSYETHTLMKVKGSAAYLLEDAWSCAPQVLAGIGDPAIVVPVLDAYCQALLVTGEAHTKQHLMKWMAK